VKLDQPNNRTADINRKKRLDSARVANGIAKRNYKLTAEQKIAICREYESGETQPKLGKQYGVTQCAIWHILKNRGIQRRHRSHARHSLNERAFDEITEESAYWIGFLMADGCVSCTKGCYTIHLALQRRDADHIYRFQSFVGSTHKVSISRNVIGLSFMSKRIADRLHEFGVVPRKSLTAAVTGGLELNRDFWRGEIDGSLGMWSMKGRVRAGFSLVGSVAMMQQFAAFVSKVIEKPFSVVNLHGKVATISLLGWRAVAMCDALYRNCSVALPRKLALSKRIALWGAEFGFNKPFQKRKCSDVQISEIVCRYNAGETAPAIAAMYGVSDDAICAYLRSRDISIRAGHARKGKHLSLQHRTALSVAATRRHSGFKGLSDEPSLFSSLGL
jgi:hypothetical protein